MADLPGELRAWIDRVRSTIDAARGTLAIRLGGQGGSTRISVRDAVQVEKAWVDDTGAASFNGVQGVSFDDLEDVPATFPPDAHMHDDRYYTEMELQTSGQAAVHWDNVTNEPATYPPGVHTHDDRYYTEMELQTSGQAAVHWDNVTNEPATYPPSAHTHDDRYYTETELATGGAGGAVHWNNVTNTPATFAPAAHKASHQNGGGDEIATATPAASAIPKADAGGKLDGWVSDGSTTVKGKVELATDGETAAGVAVQGNDARLNNARAPTAHAASHASAGGDAVALDGLSGSLVLSTGLGVRAYRNSDKTLTTGSLTPIDFNQELADTDGCHDNSTNNTRLTCQHTGWYVISGTVRFASNATGNRRVLIQLNGGNYIAEQGNPPLSGVATTLTVTTLYYLTAGDYVELIALQSSGGDLAVSYAAGLSPQFSMARCP